MSAPSPNSTAKEAPAKGRTEAPPYEPPRILSKRPVERVTLFTEAPGPGGPIGDE